MAMAEQLTRALERAGIPVWGVSIGLDNDRSTWLINYKPQATVAQRAEGEAIRLAFDVATDTAYADEQAGVRLSDPIMRALTRATFELVRDGTAAGIQGYRDKIRELLKTGAG